MPVDTFSYDHCAWAVSERAWRNSLRIIYNFLFQPAEENEAGGMLMYEDGAFGDLAARPVLWTPCSSGFESWSDCVIHTLSLRGLVK